MRSEAYSARLDPLPSTYYLPTFDQLRMADAKLWQLLAKTRKSVQCTAAGRPLDSIFEAVSQPRRCFTFCSLCRSQVVRLSFMTCRTRPERPGSFGERTQESKGKGKGMQASPVEAICFGYGLKTCQETCVKNRCPRGLHICGFPGCGQTHPALDCP